MFSNFHKADIKLTDNYFSHLSVHHVTSQLKTNDDYLCCMKFYFKCTKSSVPNLAVCPWGVEKVALYAAMILGIIMIVMNTVALAHLIKNKNVQRTNMSKVIKQLTFLILDVFCGTYLIFVSLRHIIADGSLYRVGGLKHVSCLLAGSLNITAHCFGNLLHAAVAFQLLTSMQFNGGARHVEHHITAVNVIMFNLLLVSIYPLIIPRLFDRSIAGGSYSCFQLLETEDGFLIIINHLLLILNILFNLLELLCTRKTFKTIEESRQKLLELGAHISSSSVNNYRLFNGLILRSNISIFINVSGLILMDLNRTVSIAQNMQMIVAQIYQLPQFINSLNYMWLRIVIPFCKAGKLT